MLHNSALKVYLCIASYDNMHLHDSIIRKGSLTRQKAIYQDGVGGEEYSTRATDKSVVVMG